MISPAPRIAVQIMKHNLDGIIADIPKDKRDEIEITGQGSPNWAYLTVAINLLPLFRRVYYFDGKERIEIPKSE